MREGGREEGGGKEGGREGRTDNATAFNIVYHSAGLDYLFFSYIKSLGDLIQSHGCNYQGVLNFYLQLVSFPWTLDL